MPTKIVIKKNTYFDSVSLMSVSTKANKLPGVEQAFIAMATEMNKGVLKNLGLLTPELQDAKNGDLMIVIKGDAADDETLAAIEGLFTRKESSGSHESRYATLASAKTHRPDSNLAVISVNGLFAAREARQALENGPIISNPFSCASCLSASSSSRLRHRHHQRRGVVLWQRGAPWSDWHRGCVGHWQPGIERAHS